MRNAAFLVALWTMVPLSARADDDFGEMSNPYAGDDTAADAVDEGGSSAAREEAAPDEKGDADSNSPSRRETRIKDHAIGLGYYYTHMQWRDYLTGATPQADYHAMAIRYSYFVGQAQRLGFMINAATTIPMRANQSGVTSDPGANGTYNLLSTYQRHVGFDVSLMAGTHRMLTSRLACIAGVGMHVGILKLNARQLAIHEYIAIGAASVFSLRYYIGDRFTAGVDINASFDFRDSIHHTSPLDYALNLGATATMGMHF